MGDLYHWIKALHIIAIISFMAGMLYLPRLFVYHSRLKMGSEASELFKVMERRLLRFIINPAMIVAFATGIWLMYFTNALDSSQNGKWMHYKLFLLFLITIHHGMLARYRRQFANDKNTKSEKFYRIFNEIPALIMVGIVILVVVRPV